jgi:histidinol-phosphatase (PHP family)
LGLEFDVFSDGDLSGLDYVIGGVHSIRSRDGSFVDFDGRAEYFRTVIDEHCGGDGMELARRYYEAATELPDRAKCDIIAHFDLVTKHAERVSFFDCESEQYRRYALDAIEAIAGRIPYFEVNVGAISRGYKSVPYPAPFLAKRMLELGMKPVIGTDCHHPEFLYSNVEAGAELLRSVGAKEIYVLRDEGFEPIKL